LKYKENQIPETFSYPITFLPCKDLNKTRVFYETILKLEVALVQAHCLVFKIGNINHYAYWGFCSHYDEYLYPPGKVCLTLVVEENDSVDSWYNILTGKGITCTGKPRYKPEFKIYNSFYLDPMGYTIEIQSFDPDGKPIGA